MTAAAKWTDPAAIAARVRREWTSGALLRAHAAGEPFPRIEVPLRGPSAAQLGDLFEQARAWSDAVRRGSRSGQRYDVVLGTIGGRIAGRTEVPVRAVVAEYAQAWTLLGVGAEVAAFNSMGAAAQRHPLAREWMLQNPVQAIGLAGDWPGILAAVQWLEAQRGSGLYLRQITAPGADTKFIERRRAVLAAMLGVPTRGFARALGLAEKPATVRLRFDPALFGFSPALSEGAFRADELGALQVAPRSALIVENEITYLSVPVPDGGVVLWGKGYDADESASLAWLGGVPTRYWGDLDTHGFAILNRVRSHLPQAESVLMDRATLLEHETRWGVESAPTAADLTLLTPSERALYEDLVTDRYGVGVRLEQERIDWHWTMSALV